MTTIHDNTLRAAAAVAVAMLTACGGGSNDPPGTTGTPAPRPPAMTPQDPSRVPGTPTPPAPAPSNVRVIDADTVDIDGTRYRLHGIDAPETRQTCRAWGRTWACGAAATDALKTRAEGMSCAGTDTDRYGRVIGVCSAGGDLNAWLVANGWALAYRQYSEDYVREEGEARSARRGIHRGTFIEPWRWRRGDRITGEDTFAATASSDLDVAALADRMLRGDDANVSGRQLNDSVFAIVDDTVAVSFGAASGTTPTQIGGGVWTGTLVGIDTWTGDRIDGEARLDIDDFSRPDIDVALTRITDTQGRPRSSLHWEDIPLAHGAFQAANANGSIEGRFYGHDHGEVGGVFERDRLLGAFGGQR